MRLTAQCREIYLQGYVHTAVSQCHESAIKHSYGRREHQHSVSALCRRLASVHPAPASGKAFQSRGGGKEWAEWGRGEGWVWEGGGDGGNL